MQSVKKALFTLLSSLVVLAAFAAPAFADGQYGQYGGGSSSTSEQPREEVTHATVQADLGDNLLAIAAIIGGSAIVFYILSKVTARVYLMD